MDADDKLPLNSNISDFNTLIDQDASAVTRFITAMWAVFGSKHAFILDEFLDYVSNTGPVYVKLGWHLWSPKERANVIKILMNKGIIIKEKEDEPE